MVNLYGNYTMKTVQHKILSTGLHCLIDKKGHVSVYTEKEYAHLSWWQKQKLKYFTNG